MSHGTRSYNRIYINAVAVLCCTYNMIIMKPFLKITYDLRVRPPPPSKKTSGCAIGFKHSIVSFLGRKNFNKNAEDLREQCSFSVLSAEW
jgi:hypothetical protein